LNEPRSLIIKIGGSVITDKNGELAARTQEMNRLAEEVRRAGVKNLIIVHGGGSFGHPVAERYAIKDGLKEESQKMGFSETHHFMTVLNGLLMDSLIWHKVPAVSISPSSCMMTENGRIKLLGDEPLKALLTMGFTPVLYGDAVLDTKLGFSILSGDQIVAAMALSLNAQRVIIGVDVDGLYDSDPKDDKNAKVFRRLNLQELKAAQRKLGKPTAYDVTGGMLGKMTELIPVIEQKVPVIVVNATKPDNVYKALRGEIVDGTTIEKE
jgi:isopentenyl phosphate kinase